MPPKKTQHQLADEAYLRAQQLDLSGQTPTAPIVEPEQHPDIPAVCPSCAAKMTVSSGWTMLGATTAGVGILLCGQCGHSISVPDAAYAAFKTEAAQLLEKRRAFFAKPEKPARGKRQRGAG